MKSATPRTDALVKAADGVKSVYPGDSVPNAVWSFEPEIEAIIAHARILECELSSLQAKYQKLVAHLLALEAHLQRGAPAREGKALRYQQQILLRFLGETGLKTS